MTKSENALDDVWEKLATLEKLASHPVWGIEGVILAAIQRAAYKLEYDEPTEAPGSEGVGALIAAAPVIEQLSSTVTVTWYPVKSKRAKAEKPWPGFDQR